MTLYESVSQLAEAVQWTGENLDAVFNALHASVRWRHDRYGNHLYLHCGVIGWVPVPVGHWIVHKPGDLTDLWPVDPDIFASKYQPSKRRHT